MTVCLQRSEHLSRLDPQICFRTEHGFMVEFEGYERDHSWRQDTALPDIFPIPPNVPAVEVETEFENEKLENELGWSVAKPRNLGRHYLRFGTQQRRRQPRNTPPGAGQELDQQPTPTGLAVSGRGERCDPRELLQNRRRRRPGPGGGSGSNSERS